MKKIILLATVLFFNAYVAKAQKNDLTTITVNADNIPNDKGTVIFALYDEATFMTAPPLKSAEGLPKDGKVTVVFKDVAPGTYAVLCYHDSNDNKKMDFEDSGMPLESYGASNNALGYGPPVFSDSKFEVKNEPVILKISL